MKRLEKKRSPSAAGGGAILLLLLLAAPGGIARQAQAREAGGQQEQGQRQEQAQDPTQGQSQDPTQGQTQSQSQGQGGSQEQKHDSGQDRGQARPELLTRPSADSAESATGLLAEGSSSLPVEAGGEYPLGGPDSEEMIEISVDPAAEGGRRTLSGYLIRLGTGSSDRGVAIPYFFTRTRAAGSSLEFTTATVHGTWYSFRGDITAAPDQGWRLAGTLTAHTGTIQTTQSILSRQR